MIEECFVLCITLSPGGPERTSIFKSQNHHSLSYIETFEHVLQSFTHDQPYVSLGPKHVALRETSILTTQSLIGSPNSVAFLEHKKY